jgi:AraC-like DNA-binding protein
MKAILEDIPSKKGAASFYSTRISVPAFEFKWHYHPEYELTYIVRGSGYRIVGNSHEHFSAGDLVLLGSNLPHTWWGKQEDGTPSEAIVIQFSNAFIEPFLQLQESQSIKELLTKASRGLRWDNDQMLFHSIEELGNQTEFNRILSLLSILQTLSQKESTQLASDSYHNVISKKFETRINKVCTYIQNHYSEPISLKQVSDLVFMTESNFCKFFKKATSTTFSDYLNDLRINESCQLLLSSEDTVSKIAHDCGFESLSYFNRVFLRKKQLTPSRFRRD